MRIQFNSLVIESTSQCNAKCDMCYQAAGPKGSDLIGRHDLDVGTVLGILDQADPAWFRERRFHLAGGEAWLRADQCRSLFESARERGFKTVSSTTNGFWARTRETATELVGLAKASGLTDLELSWDYWHQPYIDPSRVNNALHACKVHGVSSNLRILTTRDHGLHEALAALEPEAVNVATRVSSGPVFPTGRAADLLDRSTIYSSGSLEDSCHTTLNLTVNASGNVYPCCAGSDQTEALSFGNVRDDRLDEIVERMQHSLMLRTLVFNGAGTVAQLVPEATEGLLEEATGICDLCWMMFSDSQRAGAIAQHFDDAERTALESAASRFLQTARGDAR